MKHVFEIISEEININIIVKNSVYFFLKMRSIILNNTFFKILGLYVYVIISPYISHKLF